MTEPGASAPKSLILNSPWQAPDRHWVGVGKQLTLTQGRRPAGYEIFDTRNNTRRVEPLELVNRVRERVDAWRAADYEGVTSVTRSLLEYWKDSTARIHPFYFCQIEAIETLVWWIEAPQSFKQGIYLPGDGGQWERVCSKMATGTGKTVVMGMIITWQALNALTYPKRNKDFSKGIFVVAPGLTVKERLQVLYPGTPGNVYDEFALCPSEALRQRLNRAVIQVDNWHTLMPLKDQKRSVVKKGKESDKAYVARVLGDLAVEKDILVINDEAHHAWRVPAETKDLEKQIAALGLDKDEATQWIEGLDRIHTQLRINRCFDLTATPFAPTGKKTTDTALFDWIISDFGLNDAIEAGLVKTPRVVIRDGAIPVDKELRSRLYHIYREAAVNQDLNRRGAEPHEPLPELVQQAFTLLGADWRAAREEWLKAGHVTPPVILTVCNRTETAARIEYYFDKGDIHWPELRAPERTLRVDSKVLEKAEIGEKAGSDKAYEDRLRAIVQGAGLPAHRLERLDILDKEDLLREIVDSVGKPNRAGQGVQAVISVAMLSEGWDAKNVTHVLGLRAFTSQLLCEQVIGRGLRRVGYDTEKVVGEDGVERELFKPEYVNVFGVPLSVFQDVGEGGETPAPPKPSTQIESRPEGNAFEIRWPNVLRVDTVVRPELVVDWAKVEPLRLDPTQIPFKAEIAPAVGGAAAWDKITTIDLEQLPDEFRLQRLVFTAARKGFAHLDGRFKGRPDYLMFQLVRLVEAFLESGKIDIPSAFHSEPLRRRILISLAMDRIVAHLIKHVTEQNSERTELVFDEDKPIGSTRDMRTWYTTKPTMPVRKSQIGHVVVDSRWEAHTANVLESDPRVQFWAKNDHLGFQILYLWRGTRRRYLPDFLVRLTNGKTLVLEVKGQKDEQDQAKLEALKEWVSAVNAKGGFGVWCWDVVEDMAKVQDVLAAHGV